MRVKYSDGSEEIRSEQGVQLIYSDLKRGENEVRVVFENCETSYTVQIYYTVWQWFIVLFLLGWLWY